MDIKQINSAIMFGTWTNIELNSMIDAIKFARAGLQKQVKRSVTIGSRVQWFSPKLGDQNSGQVEKIATKYITVRDQTQRLWKVPANMLEVVA